MALEVWLIPGDPGPSDQMEPNDDWIAFTRDSELNTAGNFYISMGSRLSNPAIANSWLELIRNQHQQASSVKE